jgi:hypothetical protein
MATRYDPPTRQSFSDGTSPAFCLPLSHTWNPAIHHHLEIQRSPWNPANGGWAKNIPNSLRSTRRLS